LADGLSSLFSREMEVPRVRFGKKQLLGTLVTEETLLLAKFLRFERELGFNGSRVLLKALLRLVIYD
jgi:hypothetical protein